MTLWQPGMILTEERLNDGIDPTVVTTGLVPAANFTVADFWAARSGRVVSVMCILEYTGTGIALASGNLPDTTMCTLPSDWRPPVVVNAEWGDGTESGECTIGTTGVITLRSSNLSIPDVDPNRNMRVSVTWID
ncbi:hypothetical protein AB0I77_29710 [Streptomyces sp. NPDC050619]|uniref:hypothetical protein n=1 Tax=Streptomyces sp. NPDC050619 TaxID=3157214 RepID=UPI00343F2CA8